MGLLWHDWDARVNSVARILDLTVTEKEVWGSRNQTKDIVALVGGGNRQYEQRNTITQANKT
jgi:hypothetical protein